MSKETEKDERSRKKLLLAVSFGTSFADTREKTIGAIERRIAKRLPDWTVQRCFTSRRIRKKLIEGDGLLVDSPEEALQAARDRGIRELLVQPLYLMHGFEHRRLMGILQGEAPSFDRLVIGKPLLSDPGDFRRMADAIRRQIPLEAADAASTAVVLMGHGNVNKKKSPKAGGTDSLEDNAVFFLLQETLREAGADNYYIATVEGEPDLEAILPQIKVRGFSQVILAPFMVVAGDHATRDLAGEEDSWKSIFERKGFRVETVLRGIGEWEEVQELFADHAKACL